MSYEKTGENYNGDMSLNMARKDWCASLHWNVFCYNYSYLHTESL